MGCSAGQGGAELWPVAISRHSARQAAGDAALESRDAAQELGADEPGLDGVLAAGRGTVAGLEDCLGSSIGSS